MHRVLVVGLILSVLMIVPPASACSFAGSGPDLPARMWVWDVDDARVIDQVDLWTRGLDGDCGLNKAHDLDGARLAYADRAGDSMGVWVHTIGSEDRPQLVFRLDGHYQNIDLDGDLLSIYLQTEHHEADRAEPQRYQHIFTVDLRTGDTRRVPLDVDWLGNPRVEDAIVAWDWVSREDYHHRLNVYDLRSDTWRYENVSFSVFGVDRGRVQMANAEWLLFHGDQGFFGIRDGQRHTITAGESYRAALDGDLWLQSGFDGDLQVMTLPDGPQTEHAPTPHPVFRESAFNDGRVVLGQYAVDGPARPPSWITGDPEMAEFPLPQAWRHNPPEDPWFLNLPAPSAVVVGMLVLLVAAAFARADGRRP